MSRILIISFSDLSTDPRLDRQITALADHHEVIAAGLGPPVPDVEFIDLGSPERPVAAEFGRRAVSFALMVSRQHADRVYWRDQTNRSAVRQLISASPDLVIANDLSALPIAFSVAGSSPVVFDAHELATAEHAEQAWWRLVVAPYLDSLLRSYLPRVSAMMTVSAGIAEIYQSRYGIEPTVVTNAPPRASLQPTASGPKVRMIHHGVAFRERKLELMVDAVTRLDDRFQLDLMLVPGHQRYDHRLRRMVRRSSRVRLIDPVPQREVVSRCNRYDVGVAFFPPSNDNLRYVLPNKLFEFVQARLAVVVGPSPEMARVVRRYECGLVASEFSAAALANALRSLTPERIQTLKARADEAADDLNAERNSAVLLALVERALAG